MTDVGQRNKKGYINKTEESKKSPKRRNTEMEFSFPVSMASPYLSLRALLSSALLIVDLADVVLHVLRR